MEKRNNWNINDTIVNKETLELYTIVNMIPNSDGITEVFSKAIQKPDGVVDYLMFMDRYWVNLGDSKIWKYLYGRKS